MTIQVHKTKHFTFHNTSGNTRTGFFHRTTLVSNDIPSVQVTHKVNYINRTWERYQYQTAMLGALIKVKEELLSTLLSRFKLAFNVKRMTTANKRGYHNYLNDNLDTKIEVGSGSVTLTQILETMEELR